MFDESTPREVIREYNPELTDLEIDNILRSLHHFNVVYKPMGFFCD